MGAFVTDEGRLFRRVELRAAPDQKDAIYRSILGSSHIDLEYAALLIVAGLIALFGLIENSAAVIIGAMLISPLMNPILAAALALLLGDGKLGRRSAIVLALSVASVIAVTCLAAFVIPLKEATPQILARTTPNLLDLFIAFLSGLAGTLALRGGSVAMTILPGVAIAVAVVPPLSVVGYGLSTHQGSIAGGAFLLFITNLVAIVISAGVIFRLIGFQPRREAEQGRWKLKYRIGVSTFVLVLLSIPLFLTLRKAAIEIGVRSRLQRELKSYFKANDVSVFDLNFSRQANGLLIQATLRTDHYIETKAIHSVEEGLRAQYGPDSRLLIDQILVTRGGVSGVRTARAQNPILGGLVKQVAEKPAYNFKASGTESLQFVQTQVDGVLAGTPIVRQAVPEIDLGPLSPLVLRLRLASAEPLPVETISLLASQLGSKLGLPVQLRGQVDVKAPSLQLTLTETRPNQGMNRSDRAALSKIIQAVQQNDLHLQVTCAPDRRASGNQSIPVLASDVRRILSKSKLKNSQWELAIEPNESDAQIPQEAMSSKAGSAASTPAPAAADQFHCDVTTFQDL
jgi:uncharacterized hydrophobic protein (TIGR00271 family)